VRHAESVATAIAADLRLTQTTTACRSIARCVIDAFSPARETDDPDAAVEEVFRMVEAAWNATSPSSAAAGERASRP
jgi:hypothetical protein